MNERRLSPPGEGKRWEVYCVDVFATEPYSGNPLAVVVGNDAMEERRMQRIAAETNYSETTFVRRPQAGNGGYDVRIFTPSREIAFAGHPILGTAWVVRNYIADDKPNVLTLNIGVGEVLVRFEGEEEAREIAWFMAPEIEMGRTFDRETFAQILGLSVEDIAEEFPVQRLTAGVSALVVPVTGLDPLERSMLDLEKFKTFVPQSTSPLVYVYSRETHDSRNDVCARFFFEAYGVREDAATGNGAAFLGAYLLEHNVLERRSLSLRIEQGHKVRRLSVIHLRGSVKGDRKEIEVGGQVIPTIEGELI